MDRLAEVPFIVWVLASVGAALLILALWVRAWWRRRTEIVSVQARLVAKRISTAGLVSRRSDSQVYTSYFATFEMNDGERVEFQLYDRDYGLLVEGDEGVLSYQGTRWHGFERKLPVRGAVRRRKARRA